MPFEGRNCVGWVGGDKARASLASALGQEADGDEARRDGSA
jgi:hypothetical protein